MLILDIVSLLQNIKIKICGYRLTGLSLDHVLFNKFNAVNNVHINAPSHSDYRLYNASIHSMYLYNWLIDNNIKCEHKENFYTAALVRGIFDIGKRSDNILYAIESNNIHRVKWFLANKPFNLTQNDYVECKNIDIAQLLYERDPDFYNESMVEYAISRGDLDYLNWYYKTYKEKYLTNNDMGLMATSLHSLKSLLWVVERFAINMNAIIKKAFELETRFRDNYDIIIWLTINYQQDVMRIAKYKN